MIPLVVERSEAEILKQFGEALLPELRKVAGSHFGQTIESEVSPDGKTLEITADKYIRVLIDGRAPTSSGATKGNPTLQEMILAWVQRKNITPFPSATGKVPTLEQLSWMFSNRIHKHGTKLYQQGGGNNIFDPIITEQRINSLLSLMADHYLNRVGGINIEEKYM